jgi:toxin ParE1/3/4
LTIEWTEQAVQQLDQAYEYVRVSSSEKVAARLLTRIISSIETLSAFAMAGRPGRVQSTRELVIHDTPFIAAYTIEKSRVIVLAVYHGARRWPEDFEPTTDD